jgi:hypothetical protein
MRTLKLEPPRGLEDRVVHALHSEGLLTAETTKELSMKKIHVAWATAATILLAAGLALGRSWPESAAPEDPRPRFALMLYEDASYQVAAPGEDRVGEYVAWARSLARRGYLVDGAELASGGVLLAAATARSEAVPASERGVLAGYFIIRAVDLEEAERIARECPHLKYQGSISLRPLTM